LEHSNKSSSQGSKDRKAWHNTVFAPNWRFTLIGKSWKAHPEIFSNFQFSHEQDSITGKLILIFQQYGLCHTLKFVKYNFRDFDLDEFSSKTTCVMRRNSSPKIRKLTIG